MNAYDAAMHGGDWPATPAPGALPELPVSEAFSLTRSVYTADDMYAYARAAIASRDAKIAQLRQGEPVAYQVKSYGSTSRIVVRADVADEYACKMREAGARNVEVHPLYASPPPAQPATPQGDEKDWTEVDLWTEIYRLRAAVKGPEGYDSWQDAATAERIRRVKAEAAQPPREPVQPLSDEDMANCGLLSELRLEEERRAEWHAEMRRDAFGDKT